MAGSPVTTGWTRRINHYKAIRIISLPYWHHTINCQYSQRRSTTPPITSTPLCKAVQPVLNHSPQHTTQYEITIRYTRPSVLCIATVLTAYIIRHSSPWWIFELGLLARRLATYPESCFIPRARTKFATYHLSQLDFACMLPGAGPALPHVWTSWRETEGGGLKRRGGAWDER